MTCQNENCVCKNPKIAAVHVGLTQKPNEEFNNEIPGDVWFRESVRDVVTLEVKKLENFVALPEYKSEGAAAMDVVAAKDIFITIGTIEIVPTGIAVAVPEGYEVQIRPRSGLATEGVMVVNSPGTIDSDYRGEIMVILANFAKVTEVGSGGWQIKAGDRIAQMVISPVTRASVKVVENLSDTARGEGRFGSTGR